MLTACFAFFYRATGSCAKIGAGVANPRADFLFSGFHDFVRTGAGFLRECDPPGASSEATHIVEVCMTYVLGVSDEEQQIAVKSETDWASILPNARGNISIFMQPSSHISRPIPTGQMHGRPFLF